MNVERSGVLKTNSGSVRGLDSPRQLAMGLALGASIGLLPKENLLVVGLLVFLILSVSNLVTGAIGCCVSSVLASSLSEAFHRTGQIALNNEWFAVSLNRIFELPLVAWTRLDNTVVCGSMAFVLILFLPVYLLSLRYFSLYRAAIENGLAQSRLVNWIVGYSPQET